MTHDKDLVCFVYNLDYMQQVPGTMNFLKIYNVHSFFFYKNRFTYMMIFVILLDTTVKFYFRWGLKHLEVTIVSPVSISNGQWHQVTIETDAYNVRCLLDMSEKILRIPDEVPTIRRFSGILFVGGVPDK